MAESIGKTFAVSSTLRRASLCGLTAVALGFTVSASAAVQSNVLNLSQSVAAGGGQPVASFDIDGNGTND
ncbi:MAG: hypothetical protein AAGH92_12660, partial [Planctomycetota bacterium]